MPVLKRKKATSDVSKYIKKKKNATTTARTVQKLIQENKFIDSQRAATAMNIAWTTLVPTAGVTSCLSCPAQGVDDSNRLGRVYTINSQAIKMVVRLPAVEQQDAPQADFMYRVIMFQDTQSNGATPGGGEIMDAGALFDVLAYRTMGDVARFKILKDTGPRVFGGSHWNVADGATTDLFSRGTAIETWSWYVPFPKGIKVRCTGTTANLTSVADHSISIIGLSQSTALTLEWDSRCRFSG